MSNMNVTDEKFDPRTLSSRDFYLYQRGVAAGVAAKPRFWAKSEFWIFVLFMFLVGATGFSWFNLSNELLMFVGGMATAFAGVRGVHKAGLERETRETRAERSIPSE